MEIFISWSGPRSRYMAGELAKWLRFVNHHFRPWMSDQDIRKGDRWSQVIGEKLAANSVGIICVTPENMEAPWLLFEAGALSKALGSSRVCPVLFGLTAGAVEGPLSQFQATLVAKSEMWKLVRDLNSELGERKLDTDLLSVSFEKFWPDLESAIQGISQISIPGEHLESILEALKGQGLVRPLTGQFASFSEGFESHALYRAALQHARQRLYIFGRKNRKIFDKEHRTFLGSLKGRIENGFDLKLLFLHPECPSHLLLEAHEDDGFPEQLSECVTNGITALEKHGVDTDLVCRLYQRHRAAAMVVIDEAILFTHIEFGPHGRALTLTRHAFQAVGTATPLGERLLANFQAAWAAGVCPSLYKR